MLENTSEKFIDELIPGEKLIWSGRPQQGLVLRSSDILMIPYSLLMGGFMFLWVFSSVFYGGPFHIMLWDIPFILIFLYITIGRFFVDMVKRNKTYYALTDERAIIISGVFNQNIKTLDLKKVPEINISAKGNGKGTITFGALQLGAWMYAGSSFPSSNKNHAAPSFELIDDVRMVYKRMRNGLKEES